MEDISQGLLVRTRRLGAVRRSLITVILIALLAVGSVTVFWLIGSPDSPDGSKPSGKNGVVESGSNQGNGGPIPFVAEKLENLGSAREVLEAWLVKNGGRQHVVKLRSLRAKGDYEVGDTKSEFVLYRKFPNRLRVEAGFGDHRVLFGYDGERVWQTVRQVGRERGELRDSQTPPWVFLNCNQFNFIILDVFQGTDYGDQQARLQNLSLTGTFDVSGQTCYRLEANFGENQSLSLSLTMEHLRLIRIEAADGPRVTSVTLSDFRRRNGIEIAHRATTISPDDIVIRLTLTEVDFNPGLLSSFFKPE